MIYNVRTYTLHPRMTKKYVDLFETMAMPVAKRRGFRLIGYFTSRVGALNQCVHIWAYESMAEFEAMRAERDGDPDWHKFLEATTGLVAHQEDKLMAPTGFSPLQ
jgi:hypothetical protein